MKLKSTDKISQIKKNLTRNISILESEEYIHNICYYYYLYY